MRKAMRSASSVVSLLLLLTCSCTVAAPASAQGTTPKKQPALIKDISAVADGRHAGGQVAAVNPDVYPLTGPSWPDQPRAIGTSLWFLADNGGRRLMHKWDTQAAEPGISEVPLGATRLQNPHFPTLNRDGTALLVAAANSDQAGSDRVHEVTATGVKEIQFQPAPAWVRVDAIAATTAGGFAVLAVTSQNPAGATSRTTVWTRVGDQLVNPVEADTAYELPADLVHVEQANGAFYAFTAKAAGGTGPRRLVTVQPGATQPFTSVPIVNPALLTAFNGSLVLVDIAAWESGGVDRLCLVPGPASPPLTIASAIGIRNLQVGGSKARRILFFESGAGTAASHVATFDATYGVMVPPLDTGDVMNSVASIVQIDEATWVLGTRTGDAGSVTAVWVHDAAANEWSEGGRAFPALSNANSLTAWREVSATRFAFLAMQGAGGARTPVIAYLTVGGNLATEPVPDVAAGAAPDLLRRCGEWLFFRAAHRDRGVEPWKWRHN